MRASTCFACAALLGGLSALALACSSSSSSGSGGPSGNDGDAGADSAARGDGGHDAASAGDSSSASDSGSASDSSSAGDSAASGDSSPAGDGGFNPLGPVGDGGLLVQFVKADETTNFDSAQEEKSTGTIAFGAANAAASDNAVANLTRTGGEATIGTGGAEELVSSRMFSFGTFRFRLSLAQCATTEEVVNGPFAYFNDGTKAADGLVINREVDIEILCGEPWFINLTIWTEYTDDSHLENQARVIDTRTGTVYVYANDKEGVETGTEDHPELKIPGWPVAGQFYEMGWTWSATDLTYFMVNGTTQLTLWDATDATRIPQLPMEQHFNIWAPGDHWSTGDKAGPPASASTLTLDWFRYDPQ